MDPSTVRQQMTSALESPETPESGRDSPHHVPKPQPTGHEVLMVSRDIEDVLIADGYGYGYGYGNDSGNGNGSGNGYGDGYGYGYGNDDIWDAPTGVSQMYLLVQVLEDPC
jgi:hypothetical protein